MAEIKGFKALRFTDGDLNTLVCPPYDIISDDQRQKFIDVNPHNIVRLELPAGEERYKAAGTLLREWIDSGILAKDERDGLYLYEMAFTAYGKRQSVKGFISLVKLEEFSKGVVLPHEETLSKAKTDRFNLMSETFCNFSSIYSLYMDEDRQAFSLVEKCSQGEPDMEVTDTDGTLHRIWCVYDEAIIAQMAKIFASKKLYIADGHHRYETALNFHKHLCERGISTADSLSGYVSMMLVNMENDGLVVFPTHRILHDLPDFKPQVLIERCKDYFSVTEEASLSTLEKCLNALYDQNEKAFALYTGQDSYTLLVLKDAKAIKTLLPEMSDAYCQLDVSILHSLVLERLLGIDKDNMARQVNLAYTRSTEEAIHAVQTGSANCAFILNPTRVHEIRDVALAGEKMPQKSTYFYPKLITGMVMNNFSE